MTGRSVAKHASLTGQLPALLAGKRPERPAGACRLGVRLGEFPWPGAVHVAPHFRFRVSVPTIRPALLIRRRAGIRPIGERNRRRSRASRGKGDDGRQADTQGAGGTHDECSQCARDDRRHWGRIIGSCYSMANSSSARRRPSPMRRVRRSSQRFFARRNYLPSAGRGMVVDAPPGQPARM